MGRTDYGCHLNRRGFKSISCNYYTLGNSCNYFCKKTMNEDTRLNEWFVPKFGPIRFRIFIGLLFLPYTGMCISFTIIGSMLSPVSYCGIELVQFLLFMHLALGVSAHAADSLGSKIKPWGNYFNKTTVMAVDNFRI